MSATGTAPRPLHEGLMRIWGNPPGLRSLSAVNHTSIGLRFIVTGFLFFLIGGLLAMLMRSQLAWSENDVLDFEAYNEAFTMHGTTMMFLFAVPIMEGFAVYLIPKMLGARDLPLPRLGAYGYWCYLFGGVLLYSSFLFDAVPDAGWFMYVPLTDARFSPGAGVDFWLLSITFAEISAVSAAVELIVAILKTRAPGMSIDRMPFFAWGVLAMAFAIVFAFPPLIVASLLLEVERAFGWAFYDAARGGDPLLWQHLFWIFGHPEVYIILLPALGMISMIVATFAGRPLVSYTLAVLAVVAITILSFGLWAHHMFTVGIPYLTLSFFSAASMAVAIPSGILIFSWIATLWNGRPRLETPLLYVLGLVLIFVLGGLTGVMVALVPFDWQVHDTHFVVAHMHYVLIGGVVFPVFAAFYYWLPLVSGRVPAASLGRLAFWLMFIGFNLTFLIMHLTGLVGMPRRVFTYPAGLGWEWLNLVSTIGGFVLAAGTAVFVVDVLLHVLHGRRSDGNPWKAGTLEWAVPPGVPPYNFASIARVAGREPLWLEPELARDIERGAFHLADASGGRRETLGTSTIDGEPEQVICLSKSSWWPLLAAATTGMVFVGLLGKVYLLVPLGAALSAAVFLAWAWTTGEPRAPARIDAGLGLVLPSQRASPNAPGWSAMVNTLLVDAAAFAALLFAFFYLWAQRWSAVPLPPAHAGLSWPLAALALLALSSIAIQWGLGANARAEPRRFRRAWAAAIGLALAFGALQIREWSTGLALDPRTSAYGSLVYALIAYHLLHLAVALLMGGYALARSLRGYLDARRPLEARVTALFWHYSVAVWAVSFAVIYLVPELT